mmetsp:Transcript_520/g.1491  ORF Transcript_520/g.1491 Transcript_520/m.1491 type:complete len:157 (+) Transcript_520:199-669(+)
MAVSSGARHGKRFAAGMTRARTVFGQARQRFFSVPWSFHILPAASLNRDGCWKAALNLCDSSQAIRAMMMMIPTSRWQAGLSGLPEFMRTPNLQDLRARASTCNAKAQRRSCLLGPRSAFGHGSLSLLATSAAARCPPTHPPLVHDPWLPHGQFTS